MFDIFGGRPARDLGVDLAAIVLKGLEQADNKGKKKSAKRKSKVISTEPLLDQKISEFRKKNNFNIYSKARLGSSFKFSLMDKGLDKSDAEDLTAWILLKLR